MHECRARPHRCVMHTCKVEGPWNVRGRFLARYRQARVIADRAVRWSKAVCQQQGGEESVVEDSGGVMLCEVKCRQQSRVCQ